MCTLCTHSVYTICLCKSYVNDSTTKQGSNIECDTSHASIYIQNNSAKVSFKWNALNNSIEQHCFAIYIKLFQLKRSLLVGLTGMLNFECSKIIKRFIQIWFDLIWLSEELDSEFHWLCALLCLLFFRHTEILLITHKFKIRFFFQLKTKKQTSKKSFTKIQWQQFSPKTFLSNNFFQSHTLIATYVCRVQRIWRTIRMDRVCYTQKLSSAIEKGQHTNTHTHIKSNKFHETYRKHRYMHEYDIVA